MVSRWFSESIDSKMFTMNSLRDVFNSHLQVTNLYRKYIEGHATHHVDRSLDQFISWHYYVTSIFRAAPREDRNLRRISLFVLLCEWIISEIHYEVYIRQFYLRAANDNNLFPDHFPKSVMLASCELHGYPFSCGLRT